MIRLAQKSDSSALARLHTETLTTSFLASLGQAFLRYLYTFLIQKEKVWVYEEDNEIRGFISFSANSYGMMKRFIFQRPDCLFILALKTLLRPGNIKRFVETFTAPVKSGHSQIPKRPFNLPVGELLIISVSTTCQTSGIGSQLVKTLEDYLYLNRIPAYKVIAGEELIGANKFYIKNGFVLTTQIKIHGNKLSNVYVKNLH